MMTRRTGDCDRVPPGHVGSRTLTAGAGVLLLLGAVAMVAATGCGSGAAAGARPEFDGRAALALVKTQTDFGPRVPGSEASQQTLDWMEEFLTPLAAVVQRQPFDGYNPYAEETFEGVNLFAGFWPEKRQRIMLCAHFDSRPVANAENPPVDEPIDGAVDGAAGTAIMLQMARILAENEPRYGVDIVLFDAEDTGLPGTYDFEYWFQGSRAFARVAQQIGYEPWFAILVDLVGYAGARYRPEQFSLQYAPDIVDMVWSKADELGIDEFTRSGTSFTLYDDHWILNRDAGIPTIDITMDVSGDYPYWHTREDTYDKVDAGNLEAVGTVLVAVLYR